MADIDQNVNGFVWPCYSDGSKVQYGDKVISSHGVIEVSRIWLADGSWTVAGVLTDATNGAADSITGYASIFLLKAGEQK